MESIFLGIGALLVSVAATLFCVLLLKIKQARRASQQAQCYYCGSRAVRLSIPRGVVDRLLENWDCAPHRCEVCFRRYYRFVSGSDSARSASL